MSRVCNGLRRAALAGLLLLAPASSEAAPAVRQLLLLQSSDRGSLTLDYFTGNFRVDLDQRAGQPVNIVQVVVGPQGFVGASEQSVVDYIQSLFAGGPKPDLIMTVAGPAAAFARKHRQQLFPDTPMLFAAADQRYLRDDPLGENEAAVAVDNDFPKLVDDILQLLPQTRHVFMVMGAGPNGKFWHQQLEAESTRFRGRVTFTWSDELSLAEILRRCANLPAHSAIFYINFGTDANGGAYPDERVLGDLHATANAPLFGVQSVYVGHGIVGGSLMSIDDLVRNSADVALRLLNGAPPRSINVPAQQPNQRIFDWRELQRWGIAESRLPPGSVVRYRSSEPVARTQGHGAQRRRRAGRPIAPDRRAPVISAAHAERAEIESRRNLALAADASRRQTMSALTSSIAHELGQPLSSMIHNAQAVRMMITANRATPDTMGEILSDIEGEGVQATQIIDRHRTMLRSHQLDKKPIDLHAVIDESLALVAHDMRARQIEATVNLSSNPCIITGRSGALAAGAGEPGDERHGRDGRDTSGASSRHHQHRSQGGRCRSLGARHWNGFAGADQGHAVHTIRHDESARPRDRTHDRANDRRRAWWHH